MKDVLAPRCILFDAVGTLIYADPPVADAYRAVGERHGAELSRDEIAQRFRIAYAQTMNDDGLASAACERQRWEQVVGEVFREWPELTCDLLAELWCHFSASQAWRLFDDAAPVLHELRQRGYVVGIASNFDERLAGVCRGHAALAELPLFCSSDLGFSKPHPQFFARVAANLGARPAEILLVGDDDIADFRGATAAGWLAVLLQRHSQRGDRDGVSSLAELPSLLASSPLRD